MPCGMAKKEKGLWSQLPCHLYIFSLQVQSIFLFSLAMPHGLQDLGSLTSNWTPRLCAKALSLNHWTPREFPSSAFLIRLFVRFFFFFFNCEAFPLQTWNPWCLFIKYVVSFQHYQFSDTSGAPNYSIHSATVYLELASDPTSWRAQAQKTAPLQMPTANEVSRLPTLLPDEWQIQGFSRTTLLFNNLLQWPKKLRKMLNYVPPLLESIQFMNNQREGFIG